MDTEIAVIESTLDAIKEAPVATGPSPDTKPRVRRHPGRTPLPETLPRIDVRIEPDRCACAQCGEPLTPIGEEITEKLDYIPGRFQVMRQIRPKLACRPCGTVESPSLPASVIDKGRPTARLVAHVVAAKHCGGCQACCRLNFSRSLGLRERRFGSGPVEPHLVW